MPVSYFDGSFLAKRADTFGDSFKAVPRRRHGARLVDITGSLQLANWDTGQYEGRQSWVEAASTTVRATRTGAWRYPSAVTKALVRPTAWPSRSS